MLLDLWSEQSAAGKGGRIWRVMGLGNIDAFKATLCEVTATEPFLHRSSMIPTNSSQNQFSLQNTQTCLTITWTRMSSALTSQGVPPWRSFSKVVISTNFHIRFIAIFIVTRIQMFLWTIFELKVVASQLAPAEMGKTVLRYQFWDWKDLADVGQCFNWLI